LRFVRARGVIVIGLTMVVAITPSFMSCFVLVPFPASRTTSSMCDFCDRIDVSASEIWWHFVSVTTNGVVCATFFFDSETMTTTA
jgi:hypothetical protein